MIKIMGIRKINIIVQVMWCDKCVINIMEEKINVKRGQSKSINRESIKK